MAHFADAVANRCCCHAISVFPASGEHLRKVISRAEQTSTLWQYRARRKVGELESQVKKRVSIASALLDASFVLPTVLALFLGWPRARDDEERHPCSAIQAWRRIPMRDRDLQGNLVLQAAVLLACIRESREKLLVYVLIVFLAMFVAGIYGMVTIRSLYGCAWRISPSQVSDSLVLRTPLPERVRASDGRFSGFRGGWAIPIGLLVGAAGFISPRYRRCFAFVVSLLVTAIHSGCLASRFALRLFPDCAH